MPAAVLGSIVPSQNPVVFDDLTGHVAIREDFDEWTDADERMWFGE
ncbi:hypothetical protein [Mobiluncus porci]|nr:hypothetical protein [Mobiluncus porci]